MLSERMARSMSYLWGVGLVVVGLTACALGPLYPLLWAVFLLVFFGGGILAGGFVGRHYTRTPAVLLADGRVVAGKRFGNEPWQWWAYEGEGHWERAWVDETDLAFGVPAPITAPRWL